MDLARPSLPGRENTDQPYASCSWTETIAGAAVHCAGVKLCEGTGRFGNPDEHGEARISGRWSANSAISVEEAPMRLLIEIAAAALLVVCITASSAAFAAGKIRPQCRRPQLRLHCSAECISRRPLRRHQAPMRRQVLCERVRRQADVGGELRGGDREGMPGCRCRACSRHIVVLAKAQDPLPRLSRGRARPDRSSPDFPARSSLIFQSRLPEPFSCLLARDRFRGEAQWLRHERARKILYLLTNFEPRDLNDAITSRSRGGRCVTPI